MSFQASGGPTKKSGIFARRLSAAGPITSGRRSSMAKSPKTPRNDGTMRSTDVADATVAQVGKAVSAILQLREPLEESMATARTEQERQNIAGQIEDAAVRAISDQGLTVAEYNE